MVRFKFPIFCVPFNVAIVAGGRINFKLCMIDIYFTGSFIEILYS